MSAVATRQDAFRPAIFPNQARVCAPERSFDLEGLFLDALRHHAAMLYEGEIDPIDVQTWQFAWQSLSGIAETYDLVPPLIAPLQGGGVGVEWHDRGLNIELRFRAPYKVYAAIEDARNSIEPWSDFDPFFSHVLPALQSLSRRRAE